MPPNSCSGCFAASSRSASCPGSKKLGLDHLPPAVAAAQYHYLSNWIGGVHVEYMYETDRKAWIRYPPPRWIWRGHGDLRRARRSLARDAARMARQ